MEYCQPDALVGTDEGRGFRDKHDTFRRWMEADRRFPFPGQGHVDYVEFWAGCQEGTCNRPWADDRNIKVLCP